MSLRKPKSKFRANPAVVLTARHDADYLQPVSIVQAALGEL
jgi:hypothetical protein